MIDKRNLQINTYDVNAIRYRGPAESAELKYIFDSLKSNANKCILRTRKAQTTLNDLRKAYSYLNQYLASKIQDLDYQANNLLLNVASGLQTSIISFYDYNVVNSGILSNINTETNYGQISLAEDYSWSKVTRYTDYLGDKRPTPDVKIYLDDVLKVSTSDAYNCLDNLDYTLWIEGTTDADHVIKFQFPKGIKSKINSLKLDFFPQYNCIIKDIEYYSVKGVWESVGHYESDGKSIKIHFSPYDYGDQVRITIHPSSSSNPIIGIGNFDLFLTNYKTQGLATFKFPEIEKFTITSLNNLVVDYYIDNYTINNQFNTINPLKVYLIIDSDEYEIPYNVINGSNNLLLNVGTINQKEIKIRYELSEVNMTTPVVRGSILTFNV